MSHIPLAARLSPLDEQIDAAETVRRIEASTLQAAVDWNEGDAEVQRGLDRLQAMDMPDYYLEAKRKSFGKVSYISITDDDWPGETAWFYAGPIDRDVGDCYDLYTAPALNVSFLKRTAAELSSQLGFRYLLSTDATWGIGVRSEPAEQVPLEFIRRLMPENNYPELTLAELPDWQASFARAVPLWFEQSTNKQKAAMLEQGGSTEEIAAATIEALLAIGPVRRAWNVVVSAPFFNGLVLEHEGWTSRVTLLGAPKGLLE